MTQKIIFPEAKNLSASGILTNGLPKLARSRRTKMQIVSGSTEGGV